MTISGTEPSDAPVLRRCVGDVETFLRETWGRRVLLHHGEGLADLLTFADVDHLITSSALRAPAFRLVKAGVTLPASASTRRARVGSRTITDLLDPAKVSDEFRGGATIVLQGLHRYWPPVTQLTRELEVVLTHPVQANAYLTPPGSQGLRVHADAHDVFAIQMGGRKQWVIHAEGPDAPATANETLVAGDCMYIPKGMHHAARTVAEASLHLTIGVRTVTWVDVIKPAFNRAVADLAMDEALPAGFAHSPSATTSSIADRLRQIAEQLEHADAEALVTDAARRFWRGRQPALQGQLLQVLAAGDIDDETVVRRRPHVWAELRHTGESVLITAADRELRLPAAIEPAVKALLVGEPVRVGELAGYLDAESRVVLVRRLVTEGLLRIEPAGGDA